MKNIFNEKNLKSMEYRTTKDKNGNNHVIACSNIGYLDYLTYKSAYNPLYPDVGKVVKIPEDYLYHNSRHHLKEFIIIDGKKDSNGNQVIVGFIGNSNKTKNTVDLPGTGKATDIKTINKIIVTQTYYKKLIKKSKTIPSNKILSLVQLEEIKKRSRNTANIRRSVEFRNRNK